MKEEEFQEIFNVLSSSLRDLGLDWVVEQIELQLLEGDYEIQKVATYKEPKDSPQLPFEKEIGRSTEVQLAGEADMVVHREYTPDEKLDILIDSIEHAVVHTHEMEVDLQNLFDVVDESSEFRPSHDRILFFPEEDSESEEIEFNPYDAQQKMEIVERIKKLLDELRRSK